MVENFKDNITYGGSTLAVSGDAVIIGSTNAGAKSVIFNNTGSQGHLAWQPTANRTITLPDSSGVVQLTGQVPGAIGAGTQTQTSGTLIFSNSNGISFGMSNSSVVTASYTVPSTAGLISAINVSAGTTSNNLSAVTFSNSNGLSFGLNGSTLTGSYTVPTQTNQSIGLYGLGNTTQNSSTTLDARSLSFNGLGIVTVGYSNGSIQVSATQSNQTEGRYAIGNTTGQSSSSTFDARTLSVSGAGNVSVGYSGNALVISGAGGAGGGIAAAAGTQTQTSGTVVFSNSNGITFGMSNSSVITASFNGTLGSVVFSNSNNIVFGSAGNTTITASAFINASAGTTSNNLTNFVLSNSNNVSFGLNGSTITATATFAQTNQTEGRYAIGNTTGQSSSSTFDARTLSISGAGIVSVGYSGNALVISATGGGGAGSVNLSAGTTSNNLTNFVFSNSNNVSFGLNGSTVTATITVPAQTNQSVGLYGLGNTTQNSSTTLDARSLSFNGLGAMTVGYSNGSIQLSAPSSSNISVTGILSASANGNTLSLGVPNQTIGFYAASNTTQNSSTTLDIRSVTIQGAGIASVGYSNGSVVVSVPSAGASINVSAGTTSNNVGAITFSNSNGVSFGLNGSVITASAAGGGGGTASLFALGNTTQNSSTSLDIRSLSFNGLGAMTMGYSNGSIQVSAPAASSLSATGLVSISTNGSTISIGVPGPNFSAGTTSSNLSAIVFSNSNGVSFGLNGSTITASANGGGVAISAGANSTSTGTVVFSNSNGISFGMSNNGVITASVPAVAGSDIVFSNSNNIVFGKNVSTVTASATPYILYTYEPSCEGIGSASGLQSLGTATSNAAYFFPFIVNEYVAAGWLNIAQSMSTVSITGSGQQSQTVSYGIYTRGTGANNSTLSVITSGSYGLSVTGNSISYTINQPTSTNSTGYGYNTTSSASTNILSGYSGGKLVQLPINSTLTPGNYWLGIYARVSTSSSNCGISNSLIGLGIGSTLAGLAPIGSFSANFSTGTAVTNYVGGNWYLGLGSFTSAAQTNLPNTVALSAITQGTLMSVMPIMKFWSTI